MSAQMSLHFTAEQLAKLVGSQLSPFELHTFFDKLQG